MMGTIPMFDDLEPPRPVDLVQRMEGDDAIDLINAVSKALPRTSGNAFNHRLLADLINQLAGGNRRSLSPKQASIVAHIGMGIGFDFSATETNQ